MGLFSAFSHTQQIVWRVSRLQFPTTLPLTYVRESGKKKTLDRKPEEFSRSSEPNRLATSECSNNHYASSTLAEVG
jgi:hypothetical protein